MANDPDVVIVGGGTAGCVLAARLSADPSRRVLLLEAGDDYATAADLPADIASPLPTTNHDWGWEAIGAAGRTIAVPRARVIGGCSATNATFMVRPWPHDCDAWAAAAGDHMWSFDELLPVMRGIEQDVPVARAPIDTLPPLQHAFIDAARARGHPFVADHNEPGAIGIGVGSRNVRGDLRMSMALTHLAPARGRPNLTIRSQALVDRVVVRDEHVTGVRLDTDEVVGARTVVVAAGSYASPAILMRSGVGAATELRRHGIEVVLDLPGVGQNLADHPLASLDFHTREPDTTLPFASILSMHRRGSPSDAPPDLHLIPVGPFPAGDGTGVAAILCGLMTPRSHGSVTLRSANPNDAPVIDVGHLRDDTDVDAMVDGVIEARALLRTAALCDVAGDDRAAIATWLREQVGSYHHPVGTCAMGRDPRAGAVVDNRGRVFGVDGLVVADASIMPTIPAANTNLATIIIAETIARRMSPSSR